MNQKKEENLIINYFREFWTDLQKAKLGLTEGPFFGLGGEGFQRMNVACPRAYLEDAMKRLKNALGNF